MTELKPTERTKLRRRPQRGSHDTDAIYKILDAGILAHIGFVADGLPNVVPTTYWRDGDRFYWHGSVAGRMGRRQQEGFQVCATVSHADGFVLGRSGFTHSMNYRAAMIYGAARFETEREAKRRGMHAFIDRIFPGRAATLRPLKDAELDAMIVMWLPIEEASAKIRDGGVAEIEADLNHPVWAGVLPFHLAASAPLPDPRLGSGIPLPRYVSDYIAIARLDETLARHAEASGGA